MNHLIRKAQKTFVDTIKINVQGGTGGHGLPKFGGIGGKGGDVYIKGSTKCTRLDSLLKSPHNKVNWFKASDGKPALRTRLLGEPGQDLTLKVPVGVTITDSDGQLIADIEDPKNSYMVALGGRGGDKFNDNHGFQGQKRKLVLDYKTISDAVLVGFPNAGKSSLLRAISKAVPKVASYPFTTLRPYLGTIQFPDFRVITVADLPGLVEGAHKNIGLGHEFLKHIVRSRVLIFVVQVDKVDLGPNYAMRSPIETLCILNKEIELYDDTLLNKPAILVVSKVDSFKDRDHYIRDFHKIQQDLECLQDKNSKLYSELKESMRPTRMIDFDRIIPVSSVNNLGIDDLKTVTRDVIDKYEEQHRMDGEHSSTFKELLLKENNRIVQ